MSLGFKKGGIRNFRVPFFWFLQTSASSGPKRTGAEPIAALPSERLSLER